MTLVTSGANIGFRVREVQWLITPRKDLPVQTEFSTTWGRVFPDSSPVSHLYASGGGPRKYFVVIHDALSVFDPCRVAVA